MVNHTSSTLFVAGHQRRHERHSDGFVETLAQEHRVETARQDLPRRVLLARLEIAVVALVLSGGEELDVGLGGELHHHGDEVGCGEARTKPSHSEDDTRVFHRSRYVANHLLGEAHDAFGVPDMAAFEHGRGVGCPADKVDAGGGLGDHRAHKVLVRDAVMHNDNRTEGSVLSRIHNAEELFHSNAYAEDKHVVLDAGCRESKTFKHAINGVGDDRSLLDCCERCEVVVRCGSHFNRRGGCYGC
mmetsp:Transcript_33649/g.72595  ORF Transcript_33649/g.72595 Transcript_33649/m.72595 type:complete len:244 (+) Transcript_33649:247-978(+)